MDAKKRYVINISFLVFAVLWPLFQVEFFNGFDGVGRLQILTMLVAVIINNTSIFKSPKWMFVWVAWIIYVIVCSRIKGFTSDTNTFYTWFPRALVFPFVCMLIAFQTTKYNYRNTVFVIFVAYTIYVVVGMLFMTSEISSDGSGRTSNGLGNTFFNTSILLAAFASLAISHRKIPSFVYYLVLFVVTVTILISGERKGLIGLFVIIVGSIFAKFANKGVKTKLCITLLIGLFCIFLYSFMGSFTAGQRMQDSMDSSQFDDNWFLKLMGDRGIMYFEGTNMFFTNIFTGIGITNYRWQNGFTEGLQLHSEYMVQLAECGLIGSTLFISFYYGIFKKLLRYKKKAKKICEKRDAIILSSTMMSILLIDFVSWSYDNANYFIFYGIIWGLSNSRKRHKVAKKHRIIKRRDLLDSHIIINDNSKSVN